LRFLEFEGEVKRLVAEACESLGYGKVEVELSLPPSPDYGDLSTAVPIRLAKSGSEKPADVAVRLASDASKRLKTARYVGSVVPHRGGYLNFSIAYPAFVADAVAGVLSGAELAPRPGTGRTYAIEHTNVNPNKALHVGHARNLVLGDSLARVMAYLGNSVRALNYIDDSGAQVADVIVGFRFLGIPDIPPEGTKFDVYCGDSVYTRVNREYSGDQGLKEKQSLVLKEIERGSGEIASYARGVVKRILADQLSTCWRLGARYDLLNWESQLVHSGMWEAMFERMKRRGLVKLESEGENRGCWVIPDPDTGEQKVVVRSDGTVVYVAKDIPYAAWKIGLAGDPFGYEVYSEAQPGGGGTLYSTVLGRGDADVKFGGADIAISVIDTKQAYLQRIVGRVLERLASGASARYIHRGYEVVALSKRTASQLGFEIESEYAHMSGRKGLYVNVDAVLAALKDKAKAETRKRNPDDPQEWVEDVAEAVSVAALRYELLKQDPDKIIVFDAEDSLRFQGDTGPYLLYTYARARRIIEKAAGRPTIGAASAAKLVAPQEKALVKKLSMMDISAAAAGEYLSPKEMAKFAHGLAVAFNDFYESVQVNREEDVALREARLALVDAASRVMAKSMELIGIPRRERI
jgi:arginyl-tRNA synthetase